MKLLPLVWLAAWLASAEPKHLSNLQQLTHGGQNAEAYWSPDGKRLIFQSTRPGYECDQIFIMNADGSGSEAGLHRQRPHHLRLLSGGRQAHRLRVHA